MIKLENACYSYGKDEVLSNINLTINSGDFIGITGVNGSGKSTLIYLLSGNLPLKKGHRETTFASDEIGIQIQDAVFDDNMFVKDYIELYTNIYKLKESEYMDKVLLLELDKLYNKKIKKLSGGQRQKLNILLSIIHSPKLIFFDELTTGLDALSRMKLRKVLRLLSEEGSTIIMVSHYMDEVEELCNRVLCLKEGVIVIDSTIQDIKLKYNYKNTSELLEILLGGIHE